MNQTLFIVDRFEGEWAVIEYGRKMFNIPKNVLPNDLKEGDVLNIQFTINEEETRKRKEMIEKLTQSLFK